MNLWHLRCLKWWFFASTRVCFYRCDGVSSVYKWNELGEGKCEKGLNGSMNQSTAMGYNHNSPKAIMIWIREVEIKIQLDKI